MRTQVSKQFHKALWEHYDQYGRHDLPWRLPEPDGLFDPYKILVSELMLQQTQVVRVIPKYHEFLQLFPSLNTLAAAPLSEVLVAWSGLGYNRRAKFLWQTAQLIVQDLKGKFPRTHAGLIALPGIGPNTAGAILAYAYNEPAVYIETNVRTVYIHHFFPNQTVVNDMEIRAVMAETIDKSQPRLFYWALMDYGSKLKSSIGNLNKLSKNYSKQSPFAGSKRQIRGQVIRLLTKRSMTLLEFVAEISDERLENVLAELAQEQLIEQMGLYYRLKWSASQPATVTVLK